MFGDTSVAGSQPPAVQTASAETQPPAVETAAADTEGPAARHRDRSLLFVNFDAASLQTSTTMPIHPLQLMSVKEFAKYIDKRMLVNNQVIDNELFGSELPVRLCYPRCGIRKGLFNLLRLRFDDWLSCEEIVRCSLRWTIAVLSNFGRHWVHCNKPNSFPRANVDLHLPYQMKVPERFHLVIRAYQNTLANDALFYNGGVLDDVDIYLRRNRFEIDLSKRHMESLRNLDTKQVLYFLALVAQNGDTTVIPREPVEGNV